jgi:hypothetical protein
LPFRWSEGVWPGILVLGGLTLAFGAAAAPPLDTAGASQCETRGYAKDTDPKGTNVRSAPRADAAIVGRLAPLTKIAADEWTGVEFDIAGSKDGWLLIKNPTPGDGLKFDAAHAADGRGWISGRLVGTQLTTGTFRSAPRRDAPVLPYLVGDNYNWGPDSVPVSAVHGCDGKYVEVTATPPDGKPLRGWSYAPCANQLTTCDGWRLEE